MAGRRYASDKIVVGYFAQHQMDDLPAGKTPYEHMLDLMPEATEAQRRARLGALGLRHRQGRHQGREPVGRREGAPAVRAGDVPRAASADPRRADQPPRRRCPRGAGARAQRLRGRGDPDQPRPPPDRRLRRPAVDRARRHGAHLRRRHGPATAPNAWPSAAPIPMRRAPRRRRTARRRQTPQDARRQAAEQRAALAPLRKNVTKAEAEIELLSKRIAAIDRDLADGGLYARDPARAQALARERGGLIARPRGRRGRLARRQRGLRGRRDPGQGSRSVSRSRVPAAAAPCITCQETGAPLSTGPGKQGKLSHGFQDHRAGLRHHQSTTTGARPGRATGRLRSCTTASPLPMCARAASATARGVAPSSWSPARSWSGGPATNTSARTTTTSAATSACPSSSRPTWRRPRVSRPRSWHSGGLPPIARADGAGRAGAGRGRGQKRCRRSMRSA